MISTPGLHQHLASSQEEEDTKLIVHAADVYRSVAKIDIHSADTDAFILCLSHCGILPDGTLFVTGSNQKKNSVVIREALEELKTKALIGCHALSVLILLVRCRERARHYVGRLSALLKHVHEAFGNLGSIPTANSMKIIRIICLSAISAKHHHLTAK